MINFYKKILDEKVTEYYELYNKFGLYFEINNGKITNIRQQKENSDNEKQYN